MTLARQAIRRNSKAVGRIEETGRGDVQATCACGWTETRIGWSHARMLLEDHVKFDCAYHGAAV